MKKYLITGSGIIEKKNKVKNQENTHQSRNYSGGGITHPMDYCLCLVMKGDFIVKDAESAKDEGVR